MILDALAKPRASPNRDEPPIDPERVLHHARGKSMAMGDDRPPSGPCQRAAGRIGELGFLERAVACFGGSAFAKVSARLTHWAN